MANNTTVHDIIPEDIRYIHNIVASFISIVGFILNFVILIAIIKFRLYKQTIIIFILNLSVLYCLSCGFSLAYIAHNSFTIDCLEPPNPEMCRVFGFITYTIVGTELTALCLISFNRYCLIVHMQKYNTIYGNRRNILAMFLVSWILYFILFLFPTTETWGKMKYDKNRFLCQPFLSGDSFSKFIAYFAVGSTAPPLIFCYIGIIWKVNSSRRNLNKVMDSANNCKRQVKMPLMIICILTTFGGLYLPYIFVEGTDPGAVKYNIRIHIMAVYIAWGHLLCNPIIYALFNIQIQNALKKLFGFKVKNELIHPTQNTLEVQINVVTPRLQK